jgi:pSer/pThr/pTyr-binding forkhead associated (FHA) protein
MSTPEYENPILVIQDENQPARHWTLTIPNVVMGRGEECDITLNDRQVSRQHIRIYRQEQQYFVEDLNSKNGTWVNGVQLKGMRPLYDGDEIHVALSVRVRFIGSDATSPLLTNPPPFKSGRLRLEPEARKVYVMGQELDPPLSLPQYRLLEMLYVNSGRICTRDSVIETVWPEANGEGVSEQAIDALVRRLRDRLGELDNNFNFIVTVRGHGFRLENPPLNPES